MPVEDDVRARVRFHGRVQGVFFRAHCRDEALRLGVRGWVKNMPDGTVVGVFEGSKKGVTDLIEYCKERQPYASVSRVETFWERPTGEYRSFEIA